MEENKPQIIKIVDENGEWTNDFYVVVDTGGVKFVFEPTQSYEETLEIYKDVIEIEETDSTELDFERRFIDDDLYVYWGEIDQYTDTTQDVINSIKTASANETWWQNEEFRNAYVDIWENNYDSVKDEFDSDGFLTDLRNSSAIGAAFGEDGVTKETWNRSVDERLDPEQYGLDSELATSVVMATAINALGSTGAQIINESPNLKNALNLLAYKLNAGHFGVVGSDSAKSALAIQIEALVDPSSRAENGGYYTLNDELAKAIDGMDIPTTDKKQSEVQDILDKYAPAHLHDLFDVGDLAAKVRRNPLYIKEVEDMAKNARFSEYGMYDKDIEWAVIEGKAISLIENAWGITPQSGDSVLIDVIKMNDTNKANKYLRTKGLEIGNPKVTKDYKTAVGQAYGDDIVRVQGSLEGRYTP